MKTFIKTADGISAANPSKIRNYPSVECVRAAIASGELQDGDLFTTVAAEGISEDIEAVIQCLVTITPTTASAANMLVTQSQLDSAADVTALTARVCCNEANIAQNAACISCNASLLNQVGSRVGVNETNIAGLQQDKLDKCSFNLFYNNEYSALVADFTSQIACKVQCCDYEAYQTTLGTCFTNIDTSMSCLSNCVGSIESDISDIQSCDGLSCVGTVTSVNDISPDANGNVTLALCKGTVTALYDTESNCCFTPDSNGVLCVSGLGGGNAAYSLSGCTLTIDF